MLAHIHGSLDFHLKWGVCSGMVALWALSEVREVATAPQLRDQIS